MKVFKFLICLISYFILACYEYAFFDGVYIKDFTNFDTSIAYSSEFFESNYKTYCQNYISNYGNVWKHDAWIHVDLGHSNVLTYPFFGHHYISNEEFPGGFQERGSLSIDLFGNLPLLSKVHHILTFHGCPIYDVHGHPYVQMPIEEANSMFLHFIKNKSSSSINGVVSGNVPYVDKSYSVFWGIIIYICKNITYIVGILISISYSLYRVDIISLENFRGSVVIACYLFVLFLVFLALYSSDHSYEFINSFTQYSTDGYFDLSYIDSVLPVYENDVDYLGVSYIEKNYSELTQLKYSVYGHNYIISNTPIGGIDNIFFGHMERLCEIDNLLTFEGCPVYAKMGRLYVQMPLEKVSSMEINISHNIFYSRHITIRYIMDIIRNFFSLSSYYHMFYHLPWCFGKCLELIS